MNSARKRGPTDKQQERDNAKIACMSHLKTALCNAIQGGGPEGAINQNNYYVRRCWLLVHQKQLTGQHI